LIPFLAQRQPAAHFNERYCQSTAKVDRRYRK
jgi:hypothetical protein